MNTVTVSGWLHADPVIEHFGDLARVRAPARQSSAPDRPARRASVDRDLLRPAGRPGRRAAGGRRPRRRDRLAAHPAHRHQRQRPHAQRVDVVAERLDFLGHTTDRRPAPTRTSRPPTRTATSSTRRGDDRATPTASSSPPPCTTGPTLSPRARRGSAGCLARHLPGDWGDLDADDRAVNDHALRAAARAGSCPPTELPAELAGTTVETQVWVITDDLEDPDTATTILWPSDY